MIHRFVSGRSNAVYDIITGDESWIYCYEPESKRQSAQWIFQNEEKPTKLRRSRSVCKKMVASFFRITGHIITVPIEDRRSVNAEWYSTICLPRVLDRMRELRPKSRLIVHHDNASSHSAHQTVRFLTNSGAEILGHPPYSPDLAPCDFFLFPTVKNKMRGLHFSSAEAAVEAYEQLVLEVPLEAWKLCFENWFRRMEKCIKYKGEYFEKQ